jgi:hypothetical protein
MMKSHNRESAKVPIGAQEISSTTVNENNKRYEHSSKYKKKRTNGSARLKKSKADITKRWE